MRLALDAMGGDQAPAAAVEGALLFAREAPLHPVTLQVEPLLRGLGHGHGVAIVARGRSSARAVKDALFAALANAQVHLKDEIASALERAAAWLPRRTGRKAAEETPE